MAGGHYRTLVEVSRFAKDRPRNECAFRTNTGRLALTGSTQNACHKSAVGAGQATGYLAAWRSQSMGVFELCGLQIGVTGIYRSVDNAYLDRLIACALMPYGVQPDQRMGG